jgi:Holliday junction resolvase RusA-like endonuclease
VRGRHASVYNPDTADAWKRCIALQAAPHAPKQPLDGGVTVALTFAMPRPKRLRKTLSYLPHLAKPDVDNLAKAVLDVLTRVGFWGDDSQVWSINVAKCYALPEEEPGVWVQVIPH